MDQHPVKPLLKELQQELDRAEPMSPDDRDLLRQLLLDIHGTVGRAETATAEGDGSILDRLRGAVDRFEVTHPSLTAVMGSIADLLSNAGV